MKYHSRIIALGYETKVKSIMSFINYANVANTINLWYDLLQPVSTLLRTQYTRSCVRVNEPDKLFKGLIGVEKKKKMKDERRGSAVAFRKG